MRVYSRFRALLNALWKWGTGACPSTELCFSSFSLFSLPTTC